MKGASHHKLFALFRGRIRVTSLKVDSFQCAYCLPKKYKYKTVLTGGWDEGMAQKPRIKLENEERN